MLIILLENWNTYYIPKKIKYISTVFLTHEYRSFDNIKSIHSRININNTKLVQLNENLLWVWAKERKQTKVH